MLGRSSLASIAALASFMFAHEMTSAADVYGRGGFAYPATPERRTSRASRSSNRKVQRMALKKRNRARNRAAHR